VLIPLHVHSDYSLLRSLLRVKEIVSHAVEQGNTHACICDEGNLFGVIPFVRACLSEQITPVIGCEFAIAPRGRDKKSKIENKSMENTIQLIAQSNEGFQNLSMLSSYAYTEGFYYRPRIDDELLAKYNKDLLCIQGAARSDVGLALRKNQPDTAHKRIEWYINLYGAEHVYLALSKNGTAEQDTLNLELEKLAMEYKLATVICNEAYYKHQDDADAHDILIRIGQNRKKEGSGILFPSREFYLKTEETIRKEFPSHEEAIHNTVKIAESCTTVFEHLEPQLPEYAIPEGFKDSAEYLKHLAFAGLSERYPVVTDTHRERLDFELNTIITMGFVGYFLIIWDFVQYALAQGIPVGPGRGSGAGSLVAYALHITDIDPLQYGLLFERFLNPERISMPDFDIDFCIDGRPDIIQYITERYGQNNVSQIITFGTLKARAALKDVARVMGLPFGDVNNLVSYIPYILNESLVDVFKHQKFLKKYYTNSADYRKCVHIAEKLIGLNRHASTHPAGIVIGKKNIIDYLPLYRDPRSGLISTQYSMDALEEFGLIKMDILGLKTLTIMKNAEKMIKEYAPSFSLEKLDIHDAETYAMLSEGESRGIFQLESAGMQQILRRTKPERIEDITAINALYRPGPMQFIDMYIDNKKNSGDFEYLIPEVEEILEETYGIIVYQEQVMQIVQRIGGFSLGEADIMRRVMGKKKKNEMAAIRKKFVQGALKQGYKKVRSEKIFDILEPFAGYGFNKSHAAAYALLAFKNAYLKTHHKASFFAACLNCEYKFPDSFASFIEMVQDYHIPLIAPDVNISHREFTVRGTQEIVFGFIGIKTIAESIAQEIVRARNSHPFTSMNDFLTRTDLSILRKSAITTLIRIGAFDSISNNRKKLFLEFDSSYEAIQQQKQQVKTGQPSLFDVEELSEEKNIVIEDWTMEEKLHHEKQFLHYYVSGNPLDRYSIAQKQLLYSSSQKDRELIGVYEEKGRFTTKKNKEIVTAKLETIYGHKQLRIFSSPYEKYHDHLKNGKVIHISARQDSRDPTLYILNSVTRAIPDDEHTIETVHIQVVPILPAKTMATLLKDHILPNKGLSTLHVHEEGQNNEVLICSPQYSISPRAEVLESLRKLVFVSHVWTE